MNPSVWANCGGAIAGDETYAYDAIGNLTNKDGVGYGYPASGAGSVRPHAVVSTTAGGQFSYDANGNMTSRWIMTTAAVQTLTWTVENRLQNMHLKSTFSTVTNMMICLIKMNEIPRNHYGIFQTFIERQRDCADGA